MCHIETTDIKQVRHDWISCLTDKKAMQPKPEYQATAEKTIRLIYVHPVAAVLYNAHARWLLHAAVCRKEPSYPAVVCSTAPL